MKRVLFAVMGFAPGAFGVDYASHPPMRPLPEAWDGPLKPGPVYYVDAARGNDTGNGNAGHPWKSLGHAVARLKPGDTLCLKSLRSFK